MKKILILSSILLVLSVAVHAGHNISPCRMTCPEPWTARLGVALLHNNTHWKRHNGGNLFPKDVGGIGLSAGLMATNHFGLEVGYEKYLCKRSNVHIGPGGVIAGGAPVPSDNFAKLRTKIHQYHVPVMLLGKTNAHCGFYALGGIGLSVSHVKAHIAFYEDALGSVDMASMFSNTKILPIVKIGVGYNIKDFAVEASIKEIFKHKYHDPRFKMTAAQQNTLQYIKAQNSVTCSLGLIYNISW